MSACVLDPAAAAGDALDATWWVSVVRRVVAVAAMAGWYVGQWRDRVLMRDVRWRWRVAVAAGEGASELQSTINRNTFQHILTSNLVVQIAPVSSASHL